MYSGDRVAKMSTYFHPRCSVRPSSSQQGGDSSSPSRSNYIWLIHCRSIDKDRLLAWLIQERFTRFILSLIPLILQHCFISDNITTSRLLDSWGDARHLTQPALLLFAQCGLCLSFNYDFYCHRTPSNSIIVPAVATDLPGMESVKHTRAWIKHRGRTQS